MFPPLFLIDDEGLGTDQVTNTPPDPAGIRCDRFRGTRAAAVASPLSREESEDDERLERSAYFVRWVKSCRPRRDSKTQKACLHMSRLAEISGVGEGVGGAEGEEGVDGDVDPLRMVVVMAAVWGRFHSPSG